MKPEKECVIVYRLVAFRRGVKDWRLGSFGFGCVLAGMTLHWEMGIEGIRK
jgi:hypothetical protein